MANKPFLTKQQLREEFEDFMKSYSEQRRRYAEPRDINCTSFVLKELCDRDMIERGDDGGYRPFQGEIVI